MVTKKRVGDHLAIAENGAKKPRRLQEEGEPEAHGVDVENGDEDAASAAYEFKDGDRSVKSAPPDLKLGHMVFNSSLDMFNFFYDLLQIWPTGQNLNKFEHLMLEDLINKGHKEAEKKIGAGIEAFQVRMNSLFYSRCYYIIRKDGSITDFSYRKCVDNIAALPEEFRARSGELNLRITDKQKVWRDKKGRRSKWGGGERGGSDRAGSRF